MTTSAHPWINDQLSLRGEVARQIEPVRTGPTGYVLAVETGSRRCYFKACAGIAAHEPALAAALAAWFPEDVPPVLAVDEPRRWFLMADAGPTVRELIRADGDRSRSAEMVRRFAALQQAAIPYGDHLLALGMPDRRLDRLPDLYARLVADTPALLIGQEDGVSPADYERLQAFTPRTLCDQLADYNLPATLHHDDFHSGNTGLSGTQVRFFDWGESFVAHPFYSLLIALRDARYILHYDQTALDYVRDAYLDCWTGYEPVARLREALALTHRLAALSRALTWWQVLAHAEPDYRAENADAVPYWLLTFLNNTPME